ncbi:(S)-ureidoglycine aminohydrolase [Cricetibacter osteomyelitidis]|uniref:(S)-ureidoglycine aminohydrolase n=1 Tax=Cricetibacter osteomyelitidis TaxID=1521931 RepID=A0A4R2TG66_9PAST|nr:(S)-ureidoglycine aminohydrolase [Cricetibacter osteomyelitidis]TCP96208.1 (S)-ureidoglycine aminohydrolase [Cricetibacter osteomyelitidis]
MGYLNGQTGYRKGLLETRSVIRKENFVLLEADGLVKNSIPYYSNCDISILSSPALGASFADYIATVHPQGGNTQLGGEGIQVFVYCISGNLTVKNQDIEAELTSGGYIYSPSDKVLSFVNNSAQDTKIYIHRRRYIPLAGYAATTVVGNVNEIAYNQYEGMETCLIKDLLPAAADFGFDMNMHILLFKPGASHGYIETHFQEHGMYFLSGKGMYRLDDEWLPVQAGEYVFMDSYCPQACYAVGDEDFVYIYSKECNRDVQL